MMMVASASSGKGRAGVEPIRVGYEAGLAAGGKDYIVTAAVAKKDKMMLLAGASFDTRWDDSRN